jgi:proteasome activator subunit 4
VLAFPYEIPQWMPQVLVALAECNSNPSPIPESIRKMFREFKRTHQDNWAKQKEVFTDDELYVITDLLISPGYYA